MIPDIAISLLAVGGFCLALWWGRIVPISQGAMKVMMVGLSSMTDSELDDDAKELAVRRAGLGLIFASFSIFWRSCVALAAAAAPIFLADRIGLVSQDAVITLMLRWDYILVVCVLAVIFIEVCRRKRSAAAETAETVPKKGLYSAADRFFHMVALSSPAVLRTASWVEDRLLANPVQQPSSPPIFVTSLARGGTTVLLNALHDVPGIATHTYRDMPFLTAPGLWNRLAGGNKRGVARQPRAHGDGLEIDLDSPEAFEEVVWKMFWPDKYRGSSITLWGAEDRKPDAERFFDRHMAKVIGARWSQQHDKSAPKTRYLSKNNANIARIRYLVDAFPGCRIVVPVRRPECHAASLLRQHQNFLERQAEDDFIKRYMRDIGHFEFGQIHKPIQFPGFDAQAHDPATGDYWLNYWIHAFREILRHGDSCDLVVQDDLRSSPERTMANLCNALEISPGAMQFAGHFRSNPDRSPTDVFDRKLYEEAAELYREIETVVR